jgi:hypothetical protein
MMSKPNINLSLYKLDYGESMQEGDSLIQAKDFQKVPLTKLKSEFDTFEQINLKNAEHKREILSMFPDYLVNDADQADKDLFHAMSRYDKRNHTFVVGCVDTSTGFTLISYKWKQKGEVKWRTRGGTHPNSTPFVRIFTDSEPIMVIEGHKDSLTAILLGLDFIMLPYAGYRISDPSYLQKEIKGRGVVFLVEDEAAHTCMEKTAEQFSDTAKKILLKQLGCTDTKIDLSDYVQHFNTIKEAVDGLRD